MTIIQQLMNTNNTTHNMSQKNILIFLFLLSATLSAYCQNKNTYHINGFVDNSCAPDHGKPMISQIKVRIVSGVGSHFMAPQTKN